jgi:thiol-disulfide isomerase/thioredoxin
MSNNKIYTELTIPKLHELLNIIDSGNKKDNCAIILKFGATWCGPCERIKPLCHNLFAQMPENVTCFDIDIDDNMELYLAYKSKKMIPSIPTILGYIQNPNRDKQLWYSPDVSLVGSQQSQVEHFFKSIYTNCV